MRFTPFILFVGLIPLSLPAAPGYTNTPVLPGLPWHVHDPNRPVPPVVRPAERFSQGATAPADATVLFAGQDLAQWQGTNGAARWKVADGYMEIVPGAGSIRTREEFGDFQLHLEFATPVPATGASQERGNSGIKIHGLYEVQVLDSFENPTYPDGQCGALYGQWPPLANAAKPPGDWQSYDIIFEGAAVGTDHHADKSDGDKGSATNAFPLRLDRGEGRVRCRSEDGFRPATVTVILNGVVLHHKKAFMGTTRNRELGTYDLPLPQKGPIELQEHKNPVRYRNIWIRPLGHYD